MAEADAKTEEKAASKGSGGGKLVPIVLVVNTLLLAGLLVLQVLKPAAGKHEAKEAKEEHAAANGGEKDKPAKAVPPGPTLRLPDFVVHLRDTETERYARISFEVEVQDEKAKETVTARMPVIRDAFLAFLSDRTSQDLRGSEAILRVKTALTEKLSEAAPGGAVRALYVTDLVIQ